MPAAYELVLLRHGESEWNKKNLFCGWVDADLSENGRQEARAAGELMKKSGFEFDVAYTSVLKRAIRTLWIGLDVLDQMWIPVHRHWRLNERHYGALQGLNKAETAAKYGDEQVQIWRRSFDVPPPPLELSDPLHPSHDRRYKNVPKTELPSSEALKQCQERVLPYWHEVVAPSVKSGKKVLIVAHGNSLRALIKHLDQISDDKIAALNIPTGIPLVYELDANLRPLSHAYLGDPEEAQRKAEAVAQQAKRS